MKFDPNECVFVLLGENANTVRDMRKKYGKRLTVISDRYPLALRFMKGVSFYKIRRTYPDMYSLRLLDLARLNEEKLMVIAATEKYRKLLVRISEQIEHSYIVIL